MGVHGFRQTDDRGVRSKTRGKKEKDPRSEPGVTRKASACLSIHGQRIRLRPRTVASRRGRTETYEDYSMEKIPFLEKSENLLPAPTFLAVKQR